MGPSGLATPSQHVRVLVEDPSSDQGASAKATNFHHRSARIRFPMKWVVSETMMVMEGNTLEVLSIGTSSTKCKCPPTLPRVLMFSPCGGIANRRLKFGLLARTSRSQMVGS